MYAICVTYCMVCASVQENNPRAVASGLSPVHTHNHTITFLLHKDVCALISIVRYLILKVGISLKGAISCLTELSLMEIFVKFPILYHGSFFF